MLDRFDNALRALQRRHRRRELSRVAGLDFTSNDYLALSIEPAMRAAIANALNNGLPVGAGGSRLLRGNHSVHQALEARAADFFGTEAALFFGGGYQANQAIWSTLPARGDLVVRDALSHASTLDGLNIGRAEVAVAGHNDPNAFEAEINRWRSGGGKGAIWLAVESLYSMDGDRAPLAELVTIAERHDAFLVIDEAMQRAFTETMVAVCLLT